MAVKRHKTRVVGLSLLTRGNIDNQHFYMRTFFKGFPRDSIGGANSRKKAPKDVTIDWGGPTPVTTDLDGSKQFFRARKWVGQFFSKSGAKPGDGILIQETAPYHYRVSLWRSVAVSK